MRPSMTGIHANDGCLQAAKQEFADYVSSNGAGRLRLPLGCSSLGSKPTQYRIFESSQQFNSKFINHRRPRLVRMTFSKSPNFVVPQRRYSLTAIGLHWVLALALLAIFGVGLYMADLPFSPQRVKLYNWHKWAGVCILALSLVRLGWRLSHRPPALPQAIALAMPQWQKRVHSGVQYAMYALFFVVPLVGWAYSSAAGFPIVVFGVLPLPDFVPVDKALAELIKPWHELTAFALMGLAGVHVAAAIKHHWVDRDGLLQRMWPGRGNGAT